MKILLMANCRLGDSLVMLPALRALRQKYPEASICLASERAAAWRLFHGYEEIRIMIDNGSIFSETQPKNQPLIRRANNA